MDIYINNDTIFQILRHHFFKCCILYISVTIIFNLQIIPHLQSIRKEISTKLFHVKTISSIQGKISIIIMKNFTHPRYANFSSQYTSNLDWQLKPTSSNVLFHFFQLNRPHLRLDWFVPSCHPTFRGDGFFARANIDICTPCLLFWLTRLEKLI